MPESAQPGRVLALDDAQAWGPALARYAARWGAAEGSDWRAVGSAWSLAYLVLLLPPWVAAASLGRQVGPHTLAGWRLCLDEQGRPLALRAPEGWLAGDPALPALAGDTSGADDPGGAWPAYAPLLLGHLPAVFQPLQQHCRVPLKLLWGNVARRLAWAWDELLARAQADAAGRGEGRAEGRADGRVERPTGAALQARAPARALARVQADRVALLDAPTWPTGQPNPLAVRLRPREPRLDPAGQPLALHRQCCLYHRLPGQGRCEGCPLTGGAR